MKEIRESLKRRAIIFDVGGFRPPDDPLASWFGRVNVCAPDESWPTMDGEPMHALCQINLTGLPFRPPRLDDIEFVTLFIYYDLFRNVSGLKLGGWPSLIQSEIYWAPWNKYPAAPEYVLQIDSEPKALWAWGHGGVGYFGRGTAEGYEDEWACEWQCL